MKDDEGTIVWKLTGFFGHAESARRSESWALLQHLESLQPIPWLCVGDFNEVLDQSEKEGALLRREYQMPGFRTALEKCHLCDLCYSGSRFTWSNRRTDGTFTKEQLDRAVANVVWYSRYQTVMVQTLAARTSDHSPILVTFCEEAPKKQSYKCGFKFEASWTTDMECPFVIKDAWKNDVLGGAPMQAVQRRLSSCQHALYKWRWRKFGHADHQLKKKTKQFEEL